MRPVLATAFALALAAQALPAAAATFSDGAFADGDWSAGILLYPGSDPGASFTAGQVASGGVPGAYRQTTHNYNGPNQGIVVGHLATGAVYDPSSQGALASVALSFDAAFFNYPGTGSSPSNAVGYGMLLQQDGLYYLGPSTVTVSPSWAHFDLAGGAASFSQLNGGGGPDFSASGGAITFGYFTSNGTCCDAPTTTISGLDNWSVTTTALGVPEPATWALMIGGFAMAGTALRRRRPAFA